MPDSPKAWRSTTRTISTGSRSWRPPTRVCCRDMVGPTFPRSQRLRFLNMRIIELERSPYRGAVLAIALSLTPLVAHDMWIEPTTFLPETGQIVGVRLRVGQDMLGDPLPRDPMLINQFVVEDSSGRKPVV